MTTGHFFTLSRENPMKRYVIPILCFTILWTGAVGIRAADKTKKILYFSNSAGFEHGPVKLIEGGPSVSDKALTELGKANGFEVVCTKDGRVFDGDLAPYDAFVFYTSGDLGKGAKDHPEWAISKEGTAKFFAAVRGGKGFLGIHSASDTWRTGGDKYVNSPQEKVTEYIKMVGAEFTVHGKQQETTVTIVEPSPIPWFAAKGKSYRSFDEWYCHKNFGDDLRIFAIMETDGMQGEMYDRPACPAVWGRKEGRGRAFYCAFGHDNKYWQNPENMQLMLALIRCATGEIATDLTPNVKKVTPGAATLKRKSSALIDKPINQMRY